MAVHPGRCVGCLFGFPMCGGRPVNRPSTPLHGRTRIHLLAIIYRVGAILPAPAVPGSTRISARLNRVGTTVHPCMYVNPGILLQSVQDASFLCRTSDVRLGMECVGHIQTLCVATITRRRHAISPGFLGHYQDLGISS